MPYTIIILNLIKQHARNFYNYNMQNYSRLYLNCYCDYEDVYLKLWLFFYQSDIIIILLIKTILNTLLLPLLLTK